MKKRICSIVIFVVALTLPMLSWWIFKGEMNFTLNENRNKAPAPTLGNNFFSEFDAYFNDRAPYRDQLIYLYKKFSRSCDVSFEKFMNSLGLPYYRKSGDTILGQDDWLFYGFDHTLDYYQGTNLPTEQELQNYEQKLRKINDYFAAQGKQFVFLICPNKEEIYSEYMPKGIKVKSEKKRTDYIRDYLSSIPDIPLVYPKAEIINEKANRLLYYKQDTHWNQAGALVAVKEVLNALNIEIGEADISKTTKSGGDLADFGAVDYITYDDYIVNYRPEIECSYTGFDSDVMVASSTSERDKTLFMLGDSFRVNMSVALSKEFKNSRIYNRFLFFDNNPLAWEFETADVIIFEAVERSEWNWFADGSVLDTFIRLYIDKEVAA